MTNDFDQIPKARSTRAARATNAHALQCVGVSPRPGFRHAPKAFTLIELLVVIGIIVLVLALAVPTFSLLTGARSIESGQNVVASMIGRARTEAINRSGKIGVFFYVDPKSDKTTLTLVQLDASKLDDADPYENYKSWQPTTVYKGLNNLSGNESADRVIYMTRDNDESGRLMVKLYRCKVSHTSGTLTLPLTNPPTGGGIRPPDSGPTAGKFENANWEEFTDGKLDILDVADAVTLPVGVGAQLIIDTNNTANTDRYVRTGLILFDPQGRLIHEDYSIKQTSTLGASMGLGADFSEANANPVGQPVQSAFGVVLFDRQTFSSNYSTPGNQPFTDNDFRLPQLSNLGASPNSIADEQNEEAWLDKNATPLLVNRYSGALMAPGQ